MNMMELDPLVKARTDFGIYANGHKFTAIDKVTQLRHLALIGLGVQTSCDNFQHPDAIHTSLFEVMARLAYEIEREIEDDEEATI